MNKDNGQILDQLAAEAGGYVTPMSMESMEWVDEFLSTCKKFGVNYAKASKKEKVFVTAVARKNFALKQAREHKIDFAQVPSFVDLLKAKI